MVDKDTPASAYSRTGYDGKTYNLVFSDEFEEEGRTFFPGDDPYWCVDVAVVVVCLPLLTQPYAFTGRLSTSTTGLPPISSGTLRVRLPPRVARSSLP